MENNELLQQVTNKAQAWLDGKYDDATKAEVKRMMDADDKTEFIEAFYKDLEFGTGGLRGIMGVGTNRMNIYTVGAATQGLANYLKKEFASEPQISVVIGHDCRNHSREFAEISANIFSANGIKVYLFDALRPTPEISFAIRELKAQSGIILTELCKKLIHRGHNIAADYRLVKFFFRYFLGRQHTVSILSPLCDQKYWLLFSNSSIRSPSISTLYGVIMYVLTAIFLIFPSCA